MALELNGTTGVSLVQDGVVTAGDLASTLDLTGKTVTLPAGTGGKVLQVVEGTMSADGAYSSTSTSFIDVGLSANITPAASGNKIVCIVSYNPRFFAQTGQDLVGESRLVADGNSVLEIGHRADNLGKLGDTVYPVVFPQLHATYTTTGTSQITIKIQSKNSYGYAFWYRWNAGRIILMEIAA